MKLKNILVGSIVAAVAIVGVATGTNKVHAAQIPWTGGNLPSIQTPVFNTYSNIPAGVGDESNFVTLRKSNGDPTVPAATNNFVDPVSAACNPGEKFDVRTYDHNGADDHLNDNGNGPTVAHGVSVAMHAPLGVTGNKFTFSSTLSAANAASVTDSGTLNCGSNVQLKLVPGTVKVYSTAYGWVNASDSSVNGNLTLGSPVAGSGNQWGCWQYRIVVVYTVEVVPAPATPLYTCDALTAESLGNRRFRYTLRYTALNGASLSNIVYNFGDSSTPVNTQNTTVEHVYAVDGQYNTTTILRFTVNGQTKEVIDAKCATTVKAAIPPTPTVLPNTGAGDMIGLFGATTVAGATAHYAYNKRKATKRG